MSANRVVTHVVVGMGEVGRAIQEVLQSPISPDVGIVHEVWPTDPPKWGNPPHEPEHTDALHICFPYSKTFESNVLAYALRYQPTDLIIHSTVPVGTSRRLDATHSPVSGKHPNLAADIKHFTKFFGGPTYAAALRANFHFKICGVAVQTVPDSEGTEAGKLLATLQYGWLIALQKEAKAFCEQVGAPYSVAYEAFNHMYNEGMYARGEDLRLPVLDDVPGPIGGHCVIPNADLISGEMFLARELLVLNGVWAERALELSKVSSHEVVTSEP